MNATPPPPGRARTPPTPLHGAKYDTYEPYSPRRSTRVAAQRTVYSHQHEHTSNSSSTNTKHRSARASTPTNKKSLSFAPASGQTFSPPLSPASPSSRTLVISPKSARRTNGKAQRHASPAPASGSDTDILPSNSLRPKPSSTETFGMLQTPAKTPRKRATHSTTTNSTARVLFPGRPVNIEDAMPSPRKARKAKYQNPFSIAAEGDDEAGSSKIQIYTDSKERIPSLDEDASNPFLSRNAAKPNKRQKKTHSARDAAMEEAVRNDEGMVYVL
jgi:hypothetical protein